MNMCNSFHAIENTSNHNTGNPLGIQRYYIRPPIMCCVDMVLIALAPVFSIAWY